MQKKTLTELFGSFQLQEEATQKIKGGEHWVCSGWGTDPKTGGTTWDMTNVDGDSPPCDPSLGDPNEDCDNADGETGGRPNIGDDMGDSVINTNGKLSAIDQLSRLSFSVSGLHIYPH